jgi:hypothetical protein
MYGVHRSRRGFAAGKAVRFMLAVSSICLGFLLAGCDDTSSEDSTGSGNEFGNEVDFAGYGKLKSLKMVLNVRSMADTTSGFVVLSRITQARIMIDREEFRLSGPIELDNARLEYSTPDSSRTLSPTNYYLEIPTLEKMDSISTGAAYYRYLVGNLDVGQHVFSVRSLEGISKDGKNVIIRVDTAGSFSLESSERTKFLGLFVGRMP